MNQKALVRGLKALDLVAVAACIVVLVVIWSIQGQSNVPQGAALAFAAGVLPLMIVARHAWKLFGALGTGEVFTHQNARQLDGMSRHSIASALVWFAWIIVYAVVVRPISFAVVASLCVALVFCTALAVVCAGLSFYTEHAAALKDENDLVV